MTTRRRRSCLAVPGSNAKMLAKAAAVPADELVFDLEDAVGPADKTDATRELVIETARGLVAVEQIAAAGHGLEALLFGPGDMAASLGMPELTIGAGGDRRHYALARIVAAARAFGLQAVDGPFARLGDADGLRESALRSRALGYDGKWPIHPEQVGPLNELYAPTEAELERAQRILDAASGAGRLADEMVEEVSLKLAESILARAARG